MNSFKPRDLLFLFVIIFFAGCRSGNKTNNSHESDEQAMEMEEGTITFEPTKYKPEDIVFYNLFSPVELTYLVEKKDSYFNSSLLNPLNNITKYNISTKIALNLGVYGADISYLWMFDQSQQSLSYRAAIQRLTDKLEIPREFVNLTYSSAESNSQNFDSLVCIARITYKETDKFLKENGQDRLASFVLLGGWIETLYIATQMYEKPDANLMGRIAIQKYSLNSLISLLQLSQDDLSISEYLLLLKKLKKVYDNIQVQFPPESLVIDTVAKHIRLNQNTSVTLKPSEFSDIRRITEQIRDHIIQ